MPGAKVLMLEAISVYAYAPHCLTHPPALPRHFRWVLDRDHQGTQWQECEDCVAESALATLN